MNLGHDHTPARWGEADVTDLHLFTFNWQNYVFFTNLKRKEKKSWTVLNFGWRELQATRTWESLGLGLGDGNRWFQARRLAPSAYTSGRSSQRSCSSGRTRPNGVTGNDWLDFWQIRPHGVTRWVTCWPCSRWGGESILRGNEVFWSSVNLSCRWLPKDRPTRRDLHSMPPLGSPLDFVDPQCRLPFRFDHHYFTLFDEVSVKGHGEPKCAGGTEQWNPWHCSNLASLFLLIIVLLCGQNIQFMRLSLFWSIR